MERQPRTEMQTVAPEIRKNNFNMFLLGYTKEEAVAEAKRCFNCKNAKCSQDCPIHNYIPDFMEAVANENFAKAYEIISEKSCMPEICGTVCPHEDQCEGACINGIKGEPVAIGSVERFVAEWAAENGLTKVEKPLSNGKSVACVGAGPASMACAEVLARRGYAVTIYEKYDYIGGILAWGIPSYRLDRKAIQNKVETLEGLGVEFKFNQNITNIDKLRKEHDAVFLGIGAPNSNPMGIPGEDLQGVYPADEFLSKINFAPMDEKGRRHFDGCGKKVLICGGGNVAMDAARDAVRLEQVEKVTIVYRRSEAEMPACNEELKHAKEEGIEFLTLTNPVEFVGDNGKLAQAICAVMELGEPDASGRRRPVETDKRIMLDIDTAVLALGFSNDPTIGNATADLEADKWGCFSVNEKNATTADNVYAGGDGVTGASTAVKAMQAGINAGIAIDRKLRLGIE